MPKSLILIAALVVGATVAAVLALHGTGEAGLRAAIRATARTSLVCLVLALVGIRARAFLVALPISHAIHYALIAALAATTSAAGAGVNVGSVVYGLAIFALMIYAAIRPKPAALYVLWVIFLVAVGVNAGRGWIYPALLVLLLLAVALRLFVRPRLLQSA